MPPGSVHAGQQHGSGAALAWGKPLCSSEDRSAAPLSLLGPIVHIHALLRRGSTIGWAASTRPAPMRPAPYKPLRCAWKQVGDLHMGSACAQTIDGSNCASRTGNLGDFDSTRHPCGA